MTNNSLAITHSNLNSIDNEGTFKSIIYTKKGRNTVVSFLFVFLLIRLSSLWCVWLVGNWIADSYTTSNTKQQITLHSEVNYDKELYLWES